MKINTDQRDMMSIAVCIRHPAPHLLYEQYHSVWERTMALGPDGLERGRRLVAELPDIGGNGPYRLRLDEHGGDVLVGNRGVPILENQ